MKIIARDKPWEPIYRTCRCGIRADGCHFYLEEATGEMICPGCAIGRIKPNKCIASQAVRGLL